jgi:hypothetical protein
MTTPATQNAQVVPNTQQQIVKPNGAPPPEAPKAPEAPKEDGRFKELETQTKRFAQQQRKFAEEKAAVAKKEAELATKSKEYEDWQAYQADKKRNPGKYLEREYGENWYDTLTKVKVEGSPTGDLIASEMDERLSAFDKKLKERELAVEKRFEELQTKEQERERQAFHSEVLSHVEKSFEKFPSVEAFWDDPSVRKSITFEIDKHFHENQRAILDGEMQLLTAEEAASIVDKRLDAIGEKFVAARSKKQPPATQAQAEQQPKRSEPPQRRSLSTDMTATSGTEWVPPKDDKERLERARAAWERVKQK